MSAPAFLAIQITISSADGARHQVALGTPMPHTLSVAAHGHTSLRIPGLRAGRYSIDVDGKPKAALIIGGEPGP